MAYSMTGFGRSQAEMGENKISVEINTVNNRFLDYQMRLPKSIAPLEQDIKNLLNGKFGRGKVTVTVSFEREQAAEEIILDEERAEAYLKIYGLLQQKYGIKDEPSFRDFVALPDLVKAKKDDEDLQEIWNVLIKAMEEAADAALSMRRAEGENLIKDMIERAASIKEITGQIESLAPANVDAYRRKLEARLKDLLDDYPVDEQRIATEVTIYSDKSDITEECIRLRSHLSQFADSLEEEGPIGKRLNFILQELNREANTIGSKSSDYEISRRVIMIKEEIERLREQVQNVE
jgi:uncharacterized protein (TIGR00255 family)